MWPFKKKEEEELQELKVPFQEPKTHESHGIAEPILSAQPHEDDAVTRKLDTILAKLEGIEQRLRNLER